LDALWDCLAYAEPPIHIIWKDFDKSKPYIGKDLPKLIKLFSDAEAEYDRIKVEYA